jgi:hypothetical protein
MSNGGSMALPPHSEQQQQQQCGAFTNSNPNLLPPVYDGMQCQGQKQQQQNYSGSYEGFNPNAGS